MLKNNILHILERLKKRLSHLYPPLDLEDKSPAISKNEALKVDKSGELHITLQDIGKLRVGFPEASQIVKARLRAEQQEGHRQPVVIAGAERIGRLRPFHPLLALDTQ